MKGLQESSPWCAIRLDHPAQPRHKKSSDIGKQDGHDQDNRIVLSNSILNTAVISNASEASIPRTHTKKHYIHSNPNSPQIPLPKILLSPPKSETGSQSISKSNPRSLSTLENIVQT